MVVVPSMTISLGAQEQFDTVSFQSPLGWQKQTDPQAVTFLKKSATGETFCTITLFRPLPAKGDARQNFETVWQTVVKERFEDTGVPDMQDPENQGGWVIENGWAEITHDRGKALAMLVVASGGGDVISLMIVTNTLEYQVEIDTFLDSLKLPLLGAPIVQPEP